MPEDLSSQNGSISIYGSILGDSNVLSRETRDVLELGLAGTPPRIRTDTHSDVACAA
jgi:hypothetical protein